MRFIATFHISQEYNWQSYVEQIETIEGIVCGCGCNPWSDKIFNKEKRTCTVFVEFKTMKEFTESAKKAERHLMTHGIIEELVEFKDVTHEEVKTEIQNMKEVLHA